MPGRRVISGSLTHVVTSHVSKLEDISSGQDTLRRPLGQLAGVVLELVSEHGSSLGVQLLSPVHAAAVAGVPLVEGLGWEGRRKKWVVWLRDEVKLQSSIEDPNLEVDKLQLAPAALLHGVNLAAADQVKVVTKVPHPEGASRSRKQATGAGAAPVSITHAGHLSLLPLVHEGIVF